MSLFTWAQIKLGEIDAKKHGLPKETFLIYSASKVVFQRVMSVYQADNFKSTSHTTNNRYVAGFLYHLPQAAAQSMMPRLSSHQRSTLANWVLMGGIDSKHLPYIQALISTEITNPSDEFIVGQGLAYDHAYGFPYKGFAIRNILPYIDDEHYRFRINVSNEDKIRYLIKQDDAYSYYYGLTAPLLFSAELEVKKLIVANSKYFDVNSYSITLYIGYMSGVIESILTKNPTYNIQNIKALDDLLKGSFYLQFNAIPGCMDYLDSLEVAKCTNITKIFDNLPSFQTGKLLGIKDAASFHVNRQLAENDALLGKHDFDDPNIDTITNPLAGVLELKRYIKASFGVT